jgi:Flp pilus assembly protein TadD
VIALAPKYAQAYNSRGNACSAKDDFDHAMADYDQAIALDPKFAQCLQSQG